MRMLAALLALAFTSAPLAADPATAPETMIGVPGASPAPAAPAPYGKPQGLLPGMLVGPKLALLPLPGVFGLGLEARLGNLIGVGVDYNVFPTVEVSDFKAGYDDVSLNARVFPWRGRFYVGAALGRRSFVAKATDSATRQEIKAEVKGTYLAPEIGWRFVWTSGLFMGIDLGYQFLLSPKTTLTLPAAASLVDPTDKKIVEDAADDFGEFGLPIISLLQLGYYF